MHQQAVLSMLNLACSWPSVWSNSRCVLQFYEVDLPHASITKQKLVDRVLPDTAKVLILLPGNLFAA